MTDTNYIRRQLLVDFEHFARRMRLKDTMDFVNCGTVTKRKLTGSLDKLTTSILQLNLRPKFQRTRQAIIITAQHVSFLQFRENNVDSQRFTIAFEFLAAVALTDIC